MVLTKYSLLQTLNVHKMPLQKCYFRDIDIVRHSTVPYAKHRVMIKTVQYLQLVRILFTVSRVL